MIADAIKRLGDQAALPKAAIELIAVIGLPASLRLIEAYRGRVIEVGHGKRARAKAQHQGLAELIGKAAVDNLVRHYAGTPLRVPQCAALIRMARDATLQARFDELTGSGRSARKAVAILVDEFGPLDESTVWRILKRPVADLAAQSVSPADDRQMGLAL